MLTSFASFVKKLTAGSNFLQEKLENFFNSIPSEIRRSVEKQQREKEFLIEDRLWEYYDCDDIITISNFKNQDEACAGDCQLEIVHTEDELKNLNDGVAYFVLEFREVTFVIKSKNPNSNIANFESYRIAVKKLKGNTFMVYLLESDIDGEMNIISSNKMELDQNGDIISI